MVYLWIYMHLSYFGSLFSHLDIQIKVFQLMWEIFNHCFFKYVSVSFWHSHYAHICLLNVLHVSETLKKKFSSCFISFSYLNYIIYINLSLYSVITHSLSSNPLLISYNKVFKSVFFKSVLTLGLPFCF